MKTMKKLLLSALLVFCGLAPAHADGYEEPITFDRLPQAAQTFLKTHFDTLTVAYIVADRKFMGVEYEVKYTDRTEVDFRSDGQWESVERKYAPVPAAIVPKQISDFVAANPIPGRSSCRAVWRSSSTPSST